MMLIRTGLAECTLLNALMVYFWWDEFHMAPRGATTKKNTNNKSVCVVAQVATKLDHLQQNVEQVLASSHSAVDF